MGAGAATGVAGLACWRTAWVFFGAGFFFGSEVAFRVRSGPERLGLRASWLQEPPTPLMAARHCEWLEIRNCAAGMILRAPRRLCRRRRVDRQGDGREQAAYGNRSRPRGWRLPVVVTELRSGIPVEHAQPLRRQAGRANPDRAAGAVHPTFLRGLPIDMNRINFSDRLEARPEARTALISGSTRPSKKWLRRGRPPAMSVIQSLSGDKRTSSKPHSANSIYAP